MKKISLYLLLTIGCTATCAGVVRPLTVQGIDYQSTVTESQSYAQAPSEAVNPRSSSSSSIKASFASAEGCNKFTGIEDSYVEIATGTVFAADLEELPKSTVEKPYADPGFSVAVDGVEEVDGVYVLGVNKTYKLVPELTTAESLTYTLMDNAAGAGSYNKWSNSVITNIKEGAFALKVADASNADNFIILNFEVRINNHVESITLDGLENGVLKVKYNTLLAVNPVILPENADVKDFTITIEDPTMAKIYAAKAFNPSRNFYELSTFKTGETNVTYTASDGSGVELKFRLIVEDRDREGEIDYTKGVLWLNEEWFGHNNGSINFIDDNYNVTYKAYERENPWQSFGATSQFATVYGGKLIVMSKLAKDGGDPREAGGRVVIADAKTLKTIARFTDIGGDGRACVGVSPEKIYLGHNAGIRVLRIDGDNYTLDAEDIEGIKGKNAYSGQVGDMVKAGKYVFAIQQSTGIHVIDTETDKLVKTIAETAVAGVVQSADGNVWVAAGKKLYCYDSETLELIDTKEIQQSITCGWGAWKSTNFKAAKKENVLFWGGASIYRWEIGKELPTDPVFALGTRKGMNGSNQAQYGTIGYDDVTGQLILATTHGASSNYRYNWYYFIDAKTGEINNSQALVPCYWFPAMPVTVDRHAPCIVLDDITLENVSAAYTVEMEKIASDADDNDMNINLSVISAPDAIADASVDGRTLTIMPKAEGTGVLTLAAESRGVVTTKTINVTVNKYSGIDGIAAAGSVTVDGRHITVKGCVDEEFRLYDMSGRLAAAFVVDSDSYSIEVAVSAGVYVLRGAGRNVKAVIR